MKPSPVEFETLNPSQRDKYQELKAQYPAGNLWLKPGIGPVFCWKTERGTLEYVLETHVISFWPHYARADSGNLPPEFS
ncbi:MAG: hypothetical protein ABIZ04_26610 [Opitutus sp.]